MSISAGKRVDAMVLCSQICEVSMNQRKMLDTVCGHKAMISLPLEKCKQGRKGTRMHCVQTERKVKWIKTHFNYRYFVFSCQAVEHKMFSFDESPQLWVFDLFSNQSIRFNKSERYGKPGIEFLPS